MALVELDQIRSQGGVQRDDRMLLRKLGMQSMSLYATAGRAASCTITCVVSAEIFSAAAAI